MYRPVPRVPDFPAMEREMLRFWEENRIFDKLREQNANGPRWSFLDGPITANNPMGVHHAWGRSLKDMYQRYHAMNGQALRYQNGFDCQGLWVEVEVEKSLGLETKREIRDYGIEKFVRACKERVLTFAARQTEQSIRLGYWCDWDDPAVLLALRDALADGDRVVTVKLPSGLTETARASEIVRKLGSAEYGGSYFTFSDENNYTIWGFLKKCHDEGFIYRGHDVMPWCGRCGTGLSQMEVAEGRRITTHTSVFVRFPDQGSGKDRAAGLDHDSVDAHVQRRGRGESGDDLPEGPARRLDVLRRQGELRARPRAGSAGRRQARDSQAALDPHHPQRQRWRRSAGRIARARPARSHLQRPVRRSSGAEHAGRRFSLRRNRRRQALPPNRIA